MKSLSEDDAVKIVPLAMSDRGMLLVNLLTSMKQDHNAILKLKTDK